MTKTNKPECVYCHKMVDLNKYHAECDCGSLYCGEDLNSLPKGALDMWVKQCAENGHIVTLKNQA